MNTILTEEEETLKELVHQVKQILKLYIIRRRLKWKHTNERPLVYIPKGEYTFH